MIVPVMAISNLVLTQQIYSEETNGAHAHYREPVPLNWTVLHLPYITLLPQIYQSLNVENVFQTLCNSSCSCPLDSEILFNP